MTEIIDFPTILHSQIHLKRDFLEVMNGPEDGRLFPLGSGTRTIGRLQTSDVSLELDQSASRTHARITKKEEHYFIEDLGSSHGTCVNGKVIQTKVKLKDGDNILIGSTLLQLRLKET